ncbi:MAG: hypothetical protein FWF44_03415, partial [Defluviitaleaceae bacterium]|nr:hypothetical protein [Defluviitaleaceae bacterium]
GMIRTAGPTITLNGAWAQNIDDPAMFIEFLGDKAGIKHQYGGGFTVYGTKDGMLTQTAYKYNLADMYYDEIDAFLAAAKDGKKIRSNIDEILITARTMDALYESATTGKEVAVG